MLLDHPDVFAVPLVHTVTPIAAARILLPFLPSVSVTDLCAQLWHVGAAITVSFTPTRAITPARTGTEPPSAHEVVAMAVAHQDPHVLKFSEACTEEYALNPDPVYLFAARHVLGQLEPW